MSPNDDAESRLRTALHRAADRVEADEYRSLGRIQARSRAAHRRRRMVAGGAGLAVVIVAALIAVPRLLDGGDDVSVIPPAGTGTTEGGSPDTTESPTTDPPSTTEAPASSPPAGSVFPGSVDDATDDPADTVTRFLDALGYGSQYDLEFAPPDPVTSVTVQGRTEGGGRGPVRSVVSLTQQDGLYYVTGATSPDIVVESPRPGDAISSPAAVHGTGRGFEAQLVVTVRDARLAALNDPTVESGLPLAGCCEALEPFSTSISFVAAAEQKGAVVVTNTSGIEDGAVGLVVVPVVLSPNGTTTVQVVLLDGEDPVTVSRTVPRTTGVLNAAIGALLAGPTAAEEAAGYGSWFSAATAGLDYAVSIDPSGTAVVDFDRALPGLIPNASTSAGSASLLAQLNGTVFQFPTVERVEYRLDGDCDAFFEWLQLSCDVLDRP